MRAGALYLVTGDRRAGKTQYALYSAVTRVVAEIVREQTRTGKVNPVEFWTNAAMDWATLLDRYPQLVGRCVAFRDPISLDGPSVSHQVDEDPLPHGVTFIDRPLEPSPENPLGNVRRAIIVIDEASMWFPEGRSDKGMQSVIDRMGHLGVELWLINPDPLRVSAAIRRAVSRWYVVINEAENPRKGWAKLRPFYPGRRVLSFRRVHDRGHIDDPQETLRHGVPEEFWDCYISAGGTYGYAVEEGNSFDAEESGKIRRKALSQFFMTWFIVATVVGLFVSHVAGSGFWQRIFSTAAIASPGVAQLDDSKAFVPSEIFGRGVAVTDGQTIGIVADRRIVRRPDGSIWKETDPETGLFAVSGSLSAALEMPGESRSPKTAFGLRKAAAIGPR